MLASVPIHTDPVICLVLIGTVNNLESTPSRSNNSPTSSLDHNEDNFDDAAASSAIDEDSDENESPSSSDDCKYPIISLS